jgi:hypothetical protein
VAGGAGLRDVLHRAELRAGVVLGDPDHRAVSTRPTAQAPNSAIARDLPPASQRLREHRRGDEVEGDQRQHAGHDQALVQRRHHVLHAREALTKKQPMMEAMIDTPPSISG